MGAPSRSIRAVAGLDPILSGVATSNNCASSDNNISFRTRVVMKLLFKIK